MTVPRQKNGKRSFDMVSSQFMIFILMSCLIHIIIHRCSTSARTKYASMHGHGDAKCKMHNAFTVIHDKTNFHRIGSHHNYNDEPDCWTYYMHVPIKRFQGGGTTSTLLDIHAVHFNVLIVRVCGLVRLVRMCGWKIARGEFRKEREKDDQVTSSDHQFAVARGQARCVFS